MTSCRERSRCELSARKEQREYEHFWEPLLDSAIICAAHKVEHYEIAGYGTVSSWACFERAQPADRNLRTGRSCAQGKRRRITGLGERAASRANQFLRKRINSTTSVSEVRRVPLTAVRAGARLVKNKPPEHGQKRSAVPILSERPAQAIALNEPIGRVFNKLP